MKFIIEFPELNSEIQWHAYSTTVSDFLRSFDCVFIIQRILVRHYPLYDEFTKKLSRSPVFPGAGFSAIKFNLVGVVGKDRKIGFGIASSNRSLYG